MRDEDVIQREMDSAKDTADELDDGDPLEALVAQTVYKTLQWVDGEGEEELDEELLKMYDDED
jgi:hypothetical protein